MIYCNFIAENPEFTRCLMQAAVRQCYIPMCAVKMLVCSWLALSLAGNVYFSIRKVTGPSFNKLTCMSA